MYIYWMIVCIEAYANNITWTQGNDMHVHVHKIHMFSTIANTALGLTFTILWSTDLNIALVYPLGLSVGTTTQ